MKKIIYGTSDFEQQLQLLYDRPAFPPAAEESARQIIAEVRRRGDAALIEFAEKFDHATLTADEFFMPLDDAKKIASTLPAEDKKAIRQALKQITAFAKATKPKNWMKRVRPGVRLGEKFTPMERVGVYIPGAGKAPRKHPWQSKDADQIVNHRIQHGRQTIAACIDGHDDPAG